MGTRQSGFTPIVRAMHSVDRIRASQERFARELGLPVDAGGYLERARDNLTQPLDAASLDEIQRVPAWRPDGDKPGELQRIDSKLALLCNVFAPFRRQDTQALGRALELPGIGDLQFAPECQGDACEASMPSVDLLILGAKGHPKPCAIAASYAEPFRGERASTRTARALAGDLSDLPGCRGLALDLASNSGRFSRLDVSALLSAISWLDDRFGTRGFRLLHLYFDAQGEASRGLRREVDRFRMRVGGEVDFRALGWSALFARLRAAAPRRAHHHDYLRLRYERSEAPSRCQ